MARVDISIQVVPQDGLNITDMTVTTMVAGAGNGVMVVYEPGARLLLRNSTGGAAVYTIKVPTPGSYSAYGLTVPDETVSVPTGKDVIYSPPSVFMQSDGKVYVDCDVAAKIALIRP